MLNPTKTKKASANCLSAWALLCRFPRFVTCLTSTPGIYPVKHTVNDFWEREIFV